MADKQLVVTPDREALVTRVADRFIDYATEVLAEESQFRVVLTGGTVGIDTLQAIANHPKAGSVDWSRVRLWWGDERFVPADNPDRNDHQAQEVFLSRLPIPEGNIYRFPTADHGDVDEAARSYGQLMRSQADPGEEWPTFHVAFAGMGPDAHVLSVFPGSAQARVDVPDILAVSDSPKPPPQRLTMTIALLNLSRKVWIVAAGAEKSTALTLALSPETTTWDAPVAGLHGRDSTEIFVDRELADAIAADPEG